VRVALLTGSYPPEICGIGDYTYRLAESLSAAQMETEIIHNRLRTREDLVRFIGTVEKIRPDIVHLQYPTFGFGHSLLPHFAANRHPMVVTIHEMSESHLLRRLSLFAFSTRSLRLVFTSQFELDYALGKAPWIRNRSVVIPIGVNISVPKEDSGSRLGVAYFGLIRPNKGVESFLELVKKSQTASPTVPAYVIGMVPEAHRDYYDRLRDCSRALTIEWIIGLDHNQVANQLSRAAVGYLPFPDGASERRGSLLAMFAARVPVITTRGAQTPASFNGLVEFAGTVDEALTKMNLIANSPTVQNRLRLAGWEYLLQRDWSAIAQQHISLYRELA
jgi:glycosyltransferase involved in cell wall biosynthesis